MKLRIYRNSLRLRLSQGDVTTLDEVGEVTERTAFGPDGSFSYSLLRRAGSGAIQARLQPRGIVVEVPESLVHEWRGSSTVGMHHRQALGGGEALEILIEKDFECLEGKMKEPGVKLYPNPNAACL